MKTQAEMQQLIIDKAGEDAEFRAQLLRNPNAAITAATSVTLPDNLTITVHEESPTQAHLVLPPSSKLSSADLTAVSGGDNSNSGVTPGY